MSTFGDRLRSTRVGRGLSQAELGEGRYSASYISHLESGRRQPTGELVAHLATRLGVHPRELVGVEASAYDDAQRSAAATACELRVYVARARGDHAAAIAAADRSRGSDVADHTDARWVAGYIKAEAQLASAQYDGCRATVEDLVRHPLAEVSGELRSQALTLRSRAERASGDLPAARRSGAAAVQAARDSGDDECLLQALRMEIAAIAETGALEEAADSCRALADVVASLPPGHLLGLGAWTLGNVAFLRGEVAAGIDLHSLARTHLRPDADVRAWARFHKASAAMRLAAGAVDDVDELIEAAGHGLALIGNAADRAELDLLRATRAIDLDDDAAALRWIATALDHERLSLHTIGEAHQLASRALERLGEAAESRTRLIAAARAFEQAGADRRASEIWRTLAGVEVERAREGARDVLG